MSLRAVTKRRRAPRAICCPDCDGRMSSHAVTVRNRYGEESVGYELRHMDCETCGSTGKVARKPDGCPCCAGPKADRCEHCASAARGGQEIHWCPKAEEAEIDYEARIALMDAPGRVRGTAGRDSTAADMGVGERSPHRGNR